MQSSFYETLNTWSFWEIKYRFFFVIEIYYHKHWYYRQHCLQFSNLGYVLYKSRTCSIQNVNETSRINKPVP